jgi:hypothetical protein
MIPALFLGACAQTGTGAHSAAAPVQLSVNHKPVVETASGNLTPSQVQGCLKALAPYVSLPAGVPPTNIRSLRVNFSSAGSATVSATYVK